MFKQIIFIVSLTVVFAAFTFAQEQPETTKSEKNEKMECSKSCCPSKESHSEMSTEGVNENSTVQIWNKVCPVKGEEVDSEAPTFEYKGKVIGFCCPGCDKKFQKDPEKYMKNLNEDGSEFIGS